MQQVEFEPRRLGVMRYLINFSSAITLQNSTWYGSLCTQVVCWCPQRVQGIPRRESEKVFLSMSKWLNRLIAANNSINNFLLIIKGEHNTAATKMQHPQQQQQQQENSSNEVKTRVILASWSGLPFQDYFIDRISFINQDNGISELSMIVYPIHVVLNMYLILLTLIKLPTTDGIDFGLGSMTVAISCFSLLYKDQLAMTEPQGYTFPTVIDINWYPLVNIPYHMYVLLGCSYFSPHCVYGVPAA